MKVIYELTKDDLEKIVSDYFVREMNFEEPEVCCVSKEANFTVTINNLDFDELH
jgi:hypothetical protein